MRATGRIAIVLAAGTLAAAACERRQEQPPAATPPPAEVPPAATAEELPAPDSVATATPPATGAQAGSPTTRQPPAATAPSGSPPSRTGRGGIAEAKPDAPITPRPGDTAPQAQQDNGAAVLQRAAAAYAKLRSLQATFVMQYNNPLLRQQTTSRGTLYQRRPDRIALRFSDPAGDVILSDGEFYWIYYPSVDAQQVIRCPAAAGGEQGVDLQAQFVGDPVQRFRHTVHAQESVGGRPADVLTLEPRERAEYRTLKVWLDTRDSLARRFEITELNNTVRRFELSDFEVNAAIPDATFRFTPPANARIVSCG